MTEVGNGQLIYHASVTISRALVGFTLAALVGIPFAAAMARSALWRNLFEPIFFLGYPVPKIALFPVFTYIFGIGAPSKIAFAFLECLYPIVVTCYLRLSRHSDPAGLDGAEFRREPRGHPATGHIARGPAEHLCRVARRAAGGDHRRRHHGNDRGLRSGSAITSRSGARVSRLRTSMPRSSMIGVCGFVLDQGLLLVRRRVVYWQREAA